MSAHVPVWETPEHAAPGLRQFRALYSAKRGEIIQQRVTEGEWTLTMAHGWQPVPHIYQIPGENLNYRLGPGIVTSRRRHYELTVVPQAAGTPLQLTAIDTPVFTQSGVYFLNGNLAGTGGVVKTCTGTLTINGASSYTGATTVSAGRLILTGTTQSPVNVATGGTLSGTGTAAGSVVVSGTIAPGDSIGTLTAGQVTLTGGSAVAIDMADWNGAPGTGYDTINAASLDLTGTPVYPITINVNGSTLANFDGSPSTFTVVSTTSGITGFSPDLFIVNSAGLPAGTGAWLVQQSGNDLVINYSGNASAAAGPPRSPPVRSPDRISGNVWIQEPKESHIPDTKQAGFVKEGEG